MSQAFVFIDKRERGDEGGGGDGGGLDRGGSNFKDNETALHTKKLSPQNSFAEIHSYSIVRLMALRDFNALRPLPVYPVFEDKKSNGSDENYVLRKIAYKRSQD